MESGAGLTVFPGIRLLAVQDPVVRSGGQGWEVWICCHPLHRPGDEARAHTRPGTSTDGLSWTRRGAALAGRPGVWDACGARATTVLPNGRAAYDGRAAKEENFAQRTGLAVPAGGPGALLARGNEPIGETRYLDVVPLASGGFRLY